MDSSQYGQYYCDGISPCFLGYIFSFTEIIVLFKMIPPTKIEPIFWIYLKLFKISVIQLGNYIAHPNSYSRSLIHFKFTLSVFALLAIILLGFIDQIAEHFFPQVKGSNFKDFTHFLDFLIFLLYISTHRVRVLIRFI